MQERREYLKPTNFAHWHVLCGPRRLLPEYIDCSLEMADRLGTTIVVGRAVPVKAIVGHTVVA